MLVQMKHEHGEAYHFTRCIEQLVKHSTIQNSAHRKPSTVFFNSGSSGTTIAEAVNVQNISIFGICEDVRHFSQHYQQSQRPNDASHRFICFRQWRSTGEGRTILGAKFKLLCSEIALSRKLLGIGHMYIYNFLFTISDNMTSQNIDLTSWDILYRE
jgi:hypothetical protein